MKNLDSEKYRFSKTWNKYGIKLYIWFQRVIFYKDHVQCDLDKFVYQQISTFFTLEIVLIIIRSWIIKNKIYVSTNQIQHAEDINQMKKLTSSCLNIRSGCPEVSCKKCVLKNFAKFIRKYPSFSLYLNNISG